MIKDNFFIGSPCTNLFYFTLLPLQRMAVSNKLNIVTEKGKKSTVYFHNCNYRLFHIRLVPQVAGQRVLPFI